MTATYCLKSEKYIGKRGKYHQKARNGNCHGLFYLQEREKRPKIKIVQRIKIMYWLSQVKKQNSTYQLLEVLVSYSLLCVSDIKNPK